MKAAKVVLTTVAAAAVLTGVFLMLRQREEAVALPNAVAATPSPATPSPPKQAVADADADTSPRYRPPPVSDAVRLQVDGIIRRHKGMSREELGRSKELTELSQRFLQLVDTPDGMEKISKAAEAIVELKLPGRDGAIQLGPPMDNMEEPLFRSWAEAAVSNDPERAQDWIVNRMNGAMFEFSFDPSMERTSEGVSVQKLPPRKKAVTPDAEE